jgi:uncharacterized protein (DUF885 family)
MSTMTPKRRCGAFLLTLALALSLGVAGAARAAEPAPDADETKALHALFDRAWEWSARTFPEFATYRGDLRFNDRLSDASAEAQAERDRDTARFLAEAQAIRRERLGATDRVSLDTFIDGQQRFVDMAAYPAARGMSLRALGGPQTQFAELLQIMPSTRREQVEQMLARMAAFPKRMDQELASLRRSAAAGWVPAKDVLGRVLVQIDTQLPVNADESPYFLPFKRLGSGIAAADQQAL